MQHGIHFISGLPRSGSTLLAGILRQNPRFHAGMTSPVGTMYMALEKSMSRRNETAVFIDGPQRRDILAGLFTNYYKEIHSTKVVFDTNRLWCAKLPAVTQLFPDAKVICCVRDVSWIMDSIERLVRRNAFEPSGMFGYGVLPHRCSGRFRRTGRLCPRRAQRRLLRRAGAEHGPGRV